VTFLKNKFSASIIDQARKEGLPAQLTDLSERIFWSSHGLRFIKIPVGTKCQHTVKLKVTRYSSSEVNIP
jgi:hypothetical protein